MYFERESAHENPDSLASLLKYKITKNLTLWENFKNNFTNNTPLEIPQTLLDLKQIPMPNFNDAIQKYHQVKLVKIPSKAMRIFAYGMGGFNATYICIWYGRLQCHLVINGYTNFSVANVVKRSNKFNLNAN